MKIIINGFWFLVGLNLGVFLMAFLLRNDWTQGYEYALRQIAGPVYTVEKNKQRIRLEIAGAAGEGKLQKQTISKEKP